MIIFLTLVGACHQDGHNLPFLGWLMNKIAERFALFRFVDLPLFARFLCFFCRRRRRRFFFIFVSFILVFCSFSLATLFLSFRCACPCVCVYRERATVCAHIVMHFHAVIISHFIVYLYHGARTLYFISRENCV